MHWTLMNGYGMYVWTAYIVSGAAISTMVVMSVIIHRTAKRKLKASHVSDTP